MICCYNWLAFKEGGKTPLNSLESRSTQLKKATKTTQEISYTWKYFAWLNVSSTLLKGSNILCLLHLGLKVDHRKYLYTDMGKNSSTSLKIDNHWKRVAITFFNNWCKEACRGGWGLIPPSGGAIVILSKSPYLPSSIYQGKSKKLHIFLDYRM